MSIKHTNGFARYELTPEDMAMLDAIELKHGEAQLSEAVDHQVCVMQAISLITTEQDRDLAAEQARRRRYRELSDRWPSLNDAEREELNELDDALDQSTLSDHPICVSESITEYMITLNDDPAVGHDDRQRLKDLIPLVVGTCPIKRARDVHGTFFELRDHTEEHAELERRRRELLEAAFVRCADFEQQFNAVREAALLK